jgi:hypothetical protein
MGKCIGCTLLTLFLYSFATVSAAPAEPQCIGPVLLAELIANPDTYHDKTVWVIVYATIDFES